MKFNCSATVPFKLWPNVTPAFNCLQNKFTVLCLVIFLDSPILMSDCYGIRDLTGGMNEVFNHVSMNSFPYFKYHHSVCLGFLYLLSKAETFWVSVSITHLLTLNTTQTHFLFVWVSYVLFVRQRLSG